MARASVIDTVMARGTLDPVFGCAGIYWARTGPLEWSRERTESEHNFISRVRSEARAGGFRILDFGGSLQVDDDDPKLSPAAAYRAMKDG